VDVPVHRVSSRPSVEDLVRRTRAEVTERGTVLLVGKRAQARQLRRLQAGLRADGLTTHYQTDGAEHHQLWVLGAGQEVPRVVGWWGGS
jgi:hypothetical protein